MRKLNPLGMKTEEAVTVMWLVVWLQELLLQQGSWCGLEITPISNRGQEGRLAQGSSLVRRKWNTHYPTSTASWLTEKSNPAWSLHNYLQNLANFNCSIKIQKKLAVNFYESAVKKESTFEAGKRHEDGREKEN